MKNARAVRGTSITTQSIIKLDVLIESDIVSTINSKH